jgi:hypothetical protein
MKSPHDVSLLINSHLDIIRPESSRSGGGLVGVSRTKSNNALLNSSNQQQQ